MRTTLAILSLVAVTSASLAAENLRPTGTNCDVTSPPAEAGEEFNHGVTLRIFPRARDIGPGYNGCQVMLVPIKGSWFVVSMAEIKDGDPKRIWSPNVRDDEKFGCRYNRGQVVAGNPDKCPVAQFLLVKSMAPGCVESKRAAVTKQGLGTRVDGCEYE